MTAVFDNGVRPCPLSTIPLTLTLSHEGQRGLLVVVRRCN